MASRPKSSSTQARTLTYWSWARGVRADSPGCCWARWPGRSSGTRTAPSSSSPRRIAAEFRTTAPPASAHLAERVAAERGDRGVAVNGHDQVEFGEHAAQHVLDPGLAADREAVRVRPPDG